MFSFIEGTDNYKQIHFLTHLCWCLLVDHDDFHTDLSAVKPNPNYLHTDAIRAKREHYFC